MNALARKCVEKIYGSDFSAPITPDDIATAKETIIRRRDTHVDSLMERLREPRVRRIVEPVILGDEPVLARNGEDYRYVMDLGLLKEDENHVLMPGNPMYGEIILRYLSHDEQEAFYGLYRRPFWISGDGGLDMVALMAEFQRFWRENSESDREVYGYKEATPHLVLTAFLQRVVNGGGRIEREFALGNRRLDICIEFAGYLARLGLSEGRLAVFNTDRTVPWDERLFSSTVHFAGRTIHVIGL